MDFQLQPVTESGKRLIRLAEDHAVEFAERADKYDREGVFPLENIEDLKRTGVMSGTLPKEFGGLGVESVHDFALCINRLGRGDASTAIGVTMHMFRPWRMTRWLKAARASGDTQRAESLENTMTRIGTGEIVIAALLSEAGTDLAHPMVEATRADGGWLLNGNKIFSTMSEAASVYELTCRVKADGGGYQRAVATVSSDSNGIRSRGDWDAMGMRASGSHTIEFADCFVPESDLAIAGPWGVWNGPILVSTGVINLGLMAVFLGIAEAARDLIVKSIKSGRTGSDGQRLADAPSMQRTIAEIEIEIAASRAVLGRTALFADGFFAKHDDADIPFNDLKELAKEIQIAKWLVTRKAIEVVDMALTASGGSGYMASNPLSRLYRDVRAGPFMQPFSPNEAFEFIGKVTLGLDI